MKIHVAVGIGFAMLAFSAPQPLWAQNHAQHYVLDAFGGVHAGGNAPVVNPATPYFGFDVAASIEYVPVGTSTAVGDGYMVLDKFGGVHFGGALAADPPTGITPYFGFDAARSVVLRNITPRMSNAFSPGNTVFLNTDTTYVSVLSTTIIAPSDGFLLVTSSADVRCTASGAYARGYFSLNVDSILVDPRLGLGYFQDLDCLPGTNETTHHSMQLTYPVTAGSHTAHLLTRHGAVVNMMDGFQVMKPSITAVFYDGS